MADNLLMPEGSDPYYGQKYMPSGQELRAYQPTWRDRLGAWFMGDEKTSPEYNRLMEGLIGSRGLGETGPSAIDFTPAGIPLAMNDAWHKGDDRGMAMAIFGGPMAKTADRVALKTAEEMAAKGLTREQIFKDTGWFRGVDGKWRFEIDDSGAKYNGQTGKVSKVLEHDALISAYPAVGNFGVSHANDLLVGGYYNSDMGAGRPKLAQIIDRITGYDPDAVVLGPKNRNKSTLMHELQHGIQDIEGVSMPSGDAWANKNYSDYARMANEVEARAVQKRMDLTPDQRRARPPWLDYDVPEQDQIVRFGGSGPQMSMEPPPGIRAYHGSPHDFDKFDISKIGTGEGAQAYGPGLYFAENEGVAKDYRNKLGGKAFGPKADGPVQWTLDGQPIDIGSNPSHLAAWNVHQEGDRAKALASLERQREFNLHGAQPGTPEYDYVGGPRYDQAISVLKSGAELPTPQRPGRMYEVSINAHPDDFLDWDKPLSAQSEKVRGALEGYFNLDREHQAKIDALSDRLRQKYGVSSSDPEQILAHINSVRDQASSSMFGKGKARDALDDGFELGALLKNTKARDNPLSGPVSSLFSGEKEGNIGRASALRDAGIPGIKYLDAGSRTAGEGSRNYVVFDPEIINIVRKYGVAFAASMYGLDAVNQAMGAAQDQPQNLLMQGY